MPPMQEPRWITNTRRCAEKYRKDRKRFRSSFRKPHRLALDNGRIAIVQCDLHTIPEDQERCEISMIIHYTKNHLKTSNCSGPMMMAKQNGERDPMMMTKQKGERPVVSATLCDVLYRHLKSTYRILPMPKIITKASAA